MRLGAPSSRSDKADHLDPTAKMRQADSLDQVGNVYHVDKAAKVRHADKMDQTRKVQGVGRVDKLGQVHRASRLG